jgi:hypothetical protein
MGFCINLLLLYEHIIELAILQLVRILYSVNASDVVQRLSSALEPQTACQGTTAMQMHNPSKVDGWPFEVYEVINSHKILSF